MKHYVLEFEDKQYKLRIRTRDHAEINVRLGDSFLASFQEEKQMLNVMAVLPHLLCVSAKAFESENGKLSYEDACSLIDRMVDADWTIEKFTTIMMGIGEASGFFPKGTTADMEEEMKAAEEEAKKAKAEKARKAKAKEASDAG